MIKTQCSHGYILFISVDSEAAVRYPFRMENGFDYGELSRDWWVETAKQCGASEKHAKFAAAKHRGATNTDAARSAGFGRGSEASVRSEGYRLARSNKIMQLLALAAAEAGGGYDGTLTRGESNQILT